MEIVRLRPDQLDEASAMLARAFQDDPAWELGGAERATPGGAPAVALPGELRGDRGRGVDDRRARCSAARAGSLRAGRRCTSAPMLRALVATPLRAPRGDLALLRLRPRRRGDAGGCGARAALVPRGDRRRRRRAGGRGSARALLEPGIERAERDRVPCALLTNNEENLAFYASHGFEVVQEGRTPEGGPRAWVMHRRPRSGESAGASSLAP